MTQSSSPGERDGAQGAVPAPRPPLRAGAAMVAILLVAAAGFGIYRVSSQSEALRAQEPLPHEAAPFFTVDDGRITVPATSPLRAKLGVAEVADKNIQRSLTLPAVVEADPARTAKVLPSVAGRVIDLKV